VRAAKAARSLLRDASEVHLVHVKPPPPPDVDLASWTAWEPGYDAEVATAFDRVRAALALAPEVACSSSIIRGNKARAVLDFAASVHAELLVAGHARRSRLDRLIGGSVASQLFRGAQCALLLAPDAPLRAPTDAAAPIAGIADTEVDADRANWPMELLRFTRRNAGRPVTLEIDDVELGAQVAARGYPLLGADYDWRDDSIEIALGDPAGRGHFSHVIRGPVAVSILRARDGRDRVLQVRRASSQALVTLHE
jgi:nucleotide-binding universal stress UspA family protein